MPLQIRRGSTTERLAMTPLEGEIIYDRTASAVYIGDGTTPGGLPVTAFSSQDARNVTAQLFLGNSLADNSIHTGISFQYANGRIIGNVAVNLQDYDGVIKASGFQGNYYADDSTLIINSATGEIHGKVRGDINGSIFADNSTLLVDAVSGRIPAEVVSGTFTGNVSGNVTGNLTGNVTGNITNIAADVTPLTSEQYNLGTFSKKFNKLYLTDSTTSLYIGNAVVGTNGGTGIALPAGSTVGGVAIGTGGIVPGNNYYISVKDASNGTLIDADTRNIYADLFTGPVKGNVYASNGTTVLVDSAAGTVPTAVSVSGSSQTAITQVGTLTALNSTGIISTTGSYEGYTENTSNKLASFTTSAASTSTSSFNFRKSRGTNASPTTVLTGDALSTISFLGHDGTGYQTSAAISSRATGTVGTGIVPGQIEFATADSTGTVANRVIIGNTGIVVSANINTTANINITQNTYGANTPMILLQQNHSTVDALNLNFNRGRGTSSAPVRVQAGDEIADLGFNAYVSNSDTAGSGANVQVATITVSAVGSISAGSASGKIGFFLNNGTSNDERFTMEGDGVLGVNATALSAGVGSGLVNTSGVATYMKVKFNGTYYAMPLYAINP